MKVEYGVWSLGKGAGGMRYEVGSFLYLLRGPGMDRYIHEGWKGPRWR
jgi:hypothetical protein